MSTEKLVEYQRVVEDLILYDAKTFQNLKDILLAVPSLSEEDNNQLRSKLEASTCKFCTAPRLPLSVFLSLKWLPDPMQKTDDPAKFQNFSALYQSETETNEIHRPSFVEDLDEENKALLCKEKVRAKIICISCFKPRVVYGDKKQWKKDEVEVISQIENRH